ncbi:hypothetical protein CsSME_00036709 [Camellia sinensis var. sinensis]
MGDNFEPPPHVKPSLFRKFPKLCNHVTGNQSLLFTKLKIKITKRGYHKLKWHQEFSVFFSVKQALVPGYMVTKLREFPKERWLDMWRRLKNVSHHFEFQYAPKKEDAVNMLWRRVKHKVPAAKLAVHRSRRLKVPDWWRQRR